MIVRQEKDEKKKLKSWSLIPSQCAVAVDMSILVGRSVDDKVPDKHRKNG